MTKLCDLGVDDSVCSVGWAQRGTHLAVGTNLGKVQVSFFNIQFIHVFMTAISCFDSNGLCWTIIIMDCMSNDKTIINLLKRESSVIWE